MDAISFGTDGWRAPVEVVTPDRVRRVARAVAAHLADEGRGGDPLGVAYDPRESSPDLARAAAEAFARCGHPVLLPERDCPTPSLAWAIVERGLAGGLMVTASHNPPAYNGVKFVPADGAPALPPVTAAIEAHLDAGTDPVADARGSVSTADLRGPHVTQVLDRVDADLDGLTVAYDAMHGAGRGVVDEALARAGATVTRRRCERDPHFGGASPEPSPEHLDGLVAAVSDGPADLGVATDGDADRVAVVTPERGFLDENRFLAALYDWALDGGSGPAVRSVSTSSLVDRVAAARGERVVETPVGFKWVAKAMAEHDALVGGEESGGYTLDGHVREKDGVLAALCAAAMAAEGGLDARIDRLLDAHGDVYQARASLECPNDRKVAAVEALEADRPAAVAGEAVVDVGTLDGVKFVLESDAWLLVRPSGTEPKLRVYAEADSEARAAALVDAGCDLLAPLVDGGAN